MDEEQVLSSGPNSESLQEEVEEEGEENAAEVMEEQRAHALRDLALSRKKKKKQRTAEPTGASWSHVPSGHTSVFFFFLTLT